VTPEPNPIKQTEARMRLPDAAVRVIRARGYSATAIDAICLRAGLGEGQGAFILAEAQHASQVAADCLDHLRHYPEGLFPSDHVQTATSSRRRLQ
jgi:Bacterial regulatory proteins, tetR family